MEIISCIETNERLVESELGIVFSQKINDQKHRINQNGGRPAGTECGNSCSCS